MSLEQVLELLEAVSGASTLSYRKLFDGHSGMSAMSGEELLTLCVKVRSYHAQGPMGALAVVANPDQTLLFARVLGALAAADRPMKVFDGLRQARGWLDRQARLPDRKGVDQGQAALLAQAARE